MIGRYRPRCGQTKNNTHSCPSRGYKPFVPDSTDSHVSNSSTHWNFRVKNTDASWSRQREIWRWVTDIIPLKVYAQQWLLYRIQVYIFLVVLVCYMFTSMDEASEVEDEAAEAREAGTCTSQTSRVCHLNSNLRLPCLRKFHVEKKRRNKGG